LRLVTNGPSFQSIVNAKIFKQCSAFLKELTNDNQYAGVLFSKDFDAFMLGTSPTSIPMTADNVDFYWSMLELHFNVVRQREGSAGVQQRLKFYVGRIQELMASNPVEYFQANFLKDYKLAEAHTDSI
jgi:hypothetical protein